MKIREIKKTVAGRQTQDGAGVHLTRVISHPNVYDFDPFLLLDAFDSTNPDDYALGFPWHPHRGIETITYLIEGNIEHQDSLKNHGNILDGGCQWMTAGGGIIHQEMPRPSPHMLGVQLWLNLPGKEKMALPKYRDIRKENIPVVRSSKYTARLISGYLDDMAGAIQSDYVPVTFLDITLYAGESFTMQTDPQDTVFAYTITGNGAFGSSPAAYGPKQALLFEGGDSFVAWAGENLFRFLLLSGRPLHEPIAWGGPIVMNTKEQLETAFHELKSGSFIKTANAVVG
jgi:redox-sensitive bicupin YhaK (pirin superfamily)